MIKPIILLSVVFSALNGCSGEVTPTQTDGVDRQAGSPSTDVQSTQALSSRQARLWSRSCALCHVDGNAGAPTLGNVEQWASAQQKPQAMLLTSVIEGLNDMPPLGYCMACEREDFVALMHFMMPPSTIGDAHGDAQGNAQGNAQ